MFQNFKICLNSIVGGWHDKNSCKNEASWSHFESKVWSIKKLEKGRPDEDAANQFSIPGSTLATWKKKQRKKIWSFSKLIIETTKIENGNIQEVKWGYAEVVYINVCNNIPVSGPILVEKAHGFAKAFNCNNFTASNGCLRGWKEK